MVPLGAFFVALALLKQGGYPLVRSTETSLLVCVDRKFKEKKMKIQTLITIEASDEALEVIEYIEDNYRKAPEGSLAIIVDCRPNPGVARWAKAVKENLHGVVAQISVRGTQEQLDKEDPNAWASGVKKIVL